jgi:hypothetical protein
VKNATVTASTDTSLEVSFVPPDGFYSFMYLGCALEGQDIEEATLTQIKFGLTKGTCTILKPGENITVGLAASKNDEVADIYYLWGKTRIFCQVYLTLSWNKNNLRKKKELQEVSIGVSEISSRALYVYWNEPGGRYDTMDLNVQLTATTSNLYFVDKETYPECKVGKNYTYNDITNNETNDGKPSIVPQVVMFNQTILGVCPMSNFNATLTVNRVGFTSVQTFTLSKTSIFIF